MQAPIEPNLTIVPPAPIASEPPAPTAPAQAPVPWHMSIPKFPQPSLALRIVASAIVILATAWAVHFDLGSASAMGTLWTALPGLIGLFILWNTPDVAGLAVVGWKFFRNLGATGYLGLMWSLFPAVLGLLLVWKIQYVTAFLNAQPYHGWPIYVGMFIVAAGIGFFPTYGQSMLGGWVYNFAVGFPGAMLGFVGGSVIGYFIARSVSNRKVEEMINSNARARAVREALIGKGFWRTLGIVTLIRLPPNSPFAMTNLLLASSGVKFLPYLLGTAIGMAPRTAIAVWFADKANDSGAKDLGDLIKNEPFLHIVIGFGLVVVVLAILAYISNQAIKRALAEDPVALSSTTPDPTIRP